MKNLKLKNFFKKKIFFFFKNKIKCIKKNLFIFFFLKNFHYKNRNIFSIKKKGKIIKKE